jgi:nucleoside-diphosphate-sugar epimerase
MSISDLNVVLGASGGLGSAVVRNLVEQGKRVRAVCRGKPVENFDDLEHREADVLNRDQLSTALEGAQTVYNCVNMPYTRWPELFPPAMQNIISVCSEKGSRIVFGDNLYMHGHVDGPIKETSPLNAKGKKGKIRIKLAQMVMDAHEKGDLEVVIGRASDFYGPASFAGSGDLIFKRVLQGKSAQALGDVDQPHTWTYTNDFARGLIILAENPDTFGQVWHIPSAETITTRQLIEKVYHAAGETKVKISTIGPLMVSALSFFLPIMRELKEMMYEWQNPYIVDHSKFASRFGDISTSHDIAIHETVEWFRNIAT